MTLEVVNSGILPRTWPSVNHLGKGRRLAKVPLRFSPVHLGGWECCQSLRIGAWEEGRFEEQPGMGGSDDECKHFGFEALRNVHLGMQRLGHR